MTNYEKHRTEIVPIERMGRKVAIEKATKKITPCGSLNCVKSACFGIMVPTVI